jgi:hypothetical protein
MLDERDEFLLSRYPDNDLSADERARVDALLAQSPEARHILQQYRQLNGILSLRRETPAYDDATFRDAVRSGIETDPQEAFARDSLPIRPKRNRMLLQGSGWIAAAACLLLASGLAFQLYRLTASPGSTPSLLPPTDPNSPLASSIEIGSGKPINRAAGVLTILGPSAQPAQGTAIAIVNVGPSRAIANVPPEVLYERDLRKGPSRVAVLPDARPAVQRDDDSPF